MIDPEDFTRRIRDRVERYGHDGRHPWTISEYVIDCDADEFWAVVTEAIREELGQPSGATINELRAREGLPSWQIGNPSE